MLDKMTHKMEGQSPSIPMSGAATVYPYSLVKKCRMQETSVFWGKKTYGFPLNQSVDNEHRKI